MFSFQEIDISHAKMILDWRTSTRVAKHMRTKVNHGVQEQEQWIINSRGCPDFYHWLIIYQEKPIGYLSLSNYNRIGRTASWGFYIGEDEYTGLGGLVPPFFYRFCFSELGVEKINAEILFSNTSVIELHQLHGYSFTPNRDRKLDKSGNETLLIAMSLLKDRFQKSKFNRFKADFPTYLWHGKIKSFESQHSLIEVTGEEDQIETLYQLLQKRKHSISHQQMPSLAEHAEFVRNHPYRKWWLVQVVNEWLGSCYLTNENALGINLQTNQAAAFLQIIQQVKNENVPLPPIASVRPGYFFVNVATKNIALKNALDDLGATKTQNSYRI